MSRDRKAQKRLKKQEEIGNTLAGEVQRLWKHKEHIDSLKEVIEMAIEIGEGCSNGYLANFQKKAKEVLELTS
jgi:hypothetical protein